MNLTYLHIRELLQNLFALVTFIRPKSVESAHFFCNNYIQISTFSASTNRLHVLVPIVQDIENKLAQFDKAPPIDWDAAVKRLNSYERQYHTAIETAVACTRTTSGVKRRDPNRESDDIPFNYYVPLLNDFDVGKILGRGSFGAVYEAFTVGIRSKHGQLHLLATEPQGARTSGTRSQPVIFGVICRNVGALPRTWATPIPGENKGRSLDLELNPIFKLEL
ncbi:uncharacterized protein LOC111265777 [Varroa jacobsoni]|uniref:uncharacterized protein LOC111265777 n=1 Tax=Varroa jacobsoni TaxID=62625 RepID=UPI000BF91642|nr:uncharacterized protein LOC111265777 [Varroa jacobsoni]